MTYVTAKPLYVANAINGLPAVSFLEASNQGFGSISIPAGSVFSADQVSIFVVQRYDAGDGASVFWETSGSTRVALTFLHASSGNSYFDFGTCCGTDGRASAGVSATPYIKNPVIITAIKKRNGSADVTTNGATSVLSSTLVTSTIPLGSASTLFVGRSAAGNLFSGYIAEVIIFNRALKNEERKLVEKYLGKKWGIKVS